jgi:hypothetical protein
MPQATYTRLTDTELEALWNSFGDVTVDEKDRIDVPWLGWEVGTHREDIWAWFDEEHSKGVAWLFQNCIPF